MSTLGLCMIVKNEAAIIEKCFDSVLPMIDYILVCDTGSTDGTPQKVYEYLVRNKISGQVMHDPWRNFGFNRSRALKHMRAIPEVDYVLLMDADDEMVLPENFNPELFKAELKADLTFVHFILGSVQYTRGVICSNKRKFIFRGVMHEFIDGPPSGFSRAMITGFHVKANSFISNRNQPSEDGTISHKFQKDAVVLEKAIIDETDKFMIARYHFYLAQCYLNAGAKYLEDALKHYLIRTTCGFWPEEIYISFYYAARIAKFLNHPYTEVVELFLGACEVNPKRAEAWHGLAVYAREQGQYDFGYGAAFTGMQMEFDPDGLFGERWVYEYGVLDEFACHAYWCGKYQESISACKQLLACPSLPEIDKERIMSNLQNAINVLAQTRGLSNEQCSRVPAVA